MTKKYHQEHPTISFRCRSIDEYNKIKQMVEYSGKSESTFVREILLRAEKTESLSFNSGYSQGYNRIDVPCALCKDNMIFNLNDDPDAYQKVIQALSNYSHVPCIENKRKQEAAEQKKTFENTYFNRNY